MLIANLKELAKNSFRKKALLIAETGLEAIEIKGTINNQIKTKKDVLTIAAGTSMRGSARPLIKLNLSKFNRVFLVGVGKGSALASATLAKILGKRLSGGIALDIQSKEVQLPKIKLKILTGTHPLPSRQNIVATQKIIKLAKNLKKDDLLITFICGGGSALLCGSEQEMKNSLLATKLLTKAGADISELNTVRKHLSGVKGGGLAKIAYPATIVSLIVSDVPTANNDLSMVASGPTVFDRTTKKDAERILKKYCNMGTSNVPNININVRTSDVQKLIRVLAETPKNKKYFKKVKNILFLSNREPILAMAEKAKESGFKSKIYSFNLGGEAKNIFTTLVSGVLPRMEVAGGGTAILSGGETTVTLNSKFKIQNLHPPKFFKKTWEGRQIQNSKSQTLGKGGRNMEAVLAALIRINADINTNKRRYNQRKSTYQSARICVLSIASDGRDNTEAAGAIGDYLTLEKAGKLKLNPQEFLENHNSFNFFKKTGDLIYIKKTTFNVADLMLVLNQGNNE